MDFIDLAQQCAPAVHAQTMAAIVRVESGFNPFAIGVVKGSLVRQPRTLEEAVATATDLHEKGWNFSVGLSQVNKTNFKKYGLTIESAFDPCANLRAGAGILKQCFESAKGRFGASQEALQAAFSCYYSGNFSTGFKEDFKGQPSYVQKVVAIAGGAVVPMGQAVPIKVVPAISGKSTTPNSKSKEGAKATAKPSDAQPSADGPGNSPGAEPKSAFVF